MKLLYFSFFIPPLYAVQEVPIHCLKAPKLRAENIGERVLCHRPMRSEVPKIAIESYKDKIIVHNYGHGGSGWTFAPGCIQHLLRKFADQVAVSKDEPIVVVGAGVIGLLTAYMLIQAGYTDITVLAEQFDNLASHKAGGFCAPTTVSGKIINQETQAFMNAIGQEAYRFYAEIARGNNEDFDVRGAQFVPVYVMRNENRLKSYEGIVMQEPQDVIVAFSNGKNYEMKVYQDAIFMNTEIMMQSLNHQLKEKVLFMQKRVVEFDEIEAKYVFNCAGIGARDLCGDVTMTSGQGHLILLTGQEPEDLNYMIGFQADRGITQNGQVVGRSVYMFPKYAPGDPHTSIGVLGGTFIDGADDTTPNEQEFELLIDRARAFFGE